MKEDIKSYLEALKNSVKYGEQIVCHRTIPPKPGKYQPIPKTLQDSLKNYLTTQSIHSLYSHQAEAIKEIFNNNDVVVATPTASGKSLIYNLPVLDTILTAKKRKHALYLFPLKALSQDQYKNITQIESFFTEGETKRVGQLAAIYDGDTSSYSRAKIKKNVPPILITNPDMLHLSLLPYHSSWAEFFKNLKFIVLDEVHTYRGIFGSHMSWVITRLKRVAHYYGSDPQFIMLSATIGNPKSHCEKLLCSKVTLVNYSGSPVAKKHMVFMNPWDSAAYTASQLLEASVKRGLRTIVYTQSRKMTELISLWTKPRLGNKNDKLSSYRAGFLPEERRDIETKLANGSLLGVISTSALELGIDIGDLDLCVLVGYPGSIMSSWQRGGRVGRGNQESAIIMIGQEDALDQYFMRNPDDFFLREVEHAVVNPDNEIIKSRHLHCAAAEIPLHKDESIVKSSSAVINKMVHEALILFGANGEDYFATRKYPQRQVSLRGSGSQLTIIHRDSGEMLGEMDASRAMKEAHPGAIYIHRGVVYKVGELKFEAREIVVSQGSNNYYTRPITSKNTEILEVIAEKKHRNIKIYFGRVRVTERVTGYNKFNTSTNKVVNRFPLELPEQIIETEGVWLVIPDSIKSAMEEEEQHFMGGIHALEHLIISLFPLFVLCDRNDIGGISCPIHEQTLLATVFVFDGHDGGVGLAAEAYEKIDEILAEGGRVISMCACENGCPSCVHSPKCGSGNRPIDKHACFDLLEKIESSEKEFCDTLENTSMIKMPVFSSIFKEVTSYSKGMNALPERYCVFDIETKYSAEEVGGWNHSDRMGVSVAVIYDSSLGGFVSYLENEVDELIAHLVSAELIIGFNNKRFDNTVLSGYCSHNLNKRPTLDLLEEINNHLGYRLSLNRVAEFSLGCLKSGNGLEALQWYKEKNFKKIVEYCKRDVQITRDLLYYGLANDFFLFKNKAGRLVRLPLSLDKTIFNQLENA